MTDKDERDIADVVKAAQPRLRRFIARRIADPGEVEDVLQDVFARLVEANRLVMPIDHVAAWLFRVARNRLTDLFRKQRPLRLDDVAPPDEDGMGLDDLLPSLDDGPDALLARRALVDEIEDALAALPAEQRDVFVAHELEGKSFRTLSAETGVSVNTLLSRKHYAVRRLRARLQTSYDGLRKDRP